MTTVNIKGVGNAQFPDGMSQDQIGEFLRAKFPPAREAQIKPFEPSLSQKIGQNLSDFLIDKGIVSNRYSAQQVGNALTALGEFIPGLGDAVAGDEFGRAVAEGDNLGMAMAGLGAIPVVGDAARYVANQGSANIDAMYDLLSDVGKSKSIGEEKGRKVKNGISKFTSPFGSTRYVEYVDGKPVSSLQVMSQDGKEATIANVFTIPEEQKKGRASKLLKRARKDFNKVEHSKDLTEQGAAFARSVEGAKSQDDVKNLYKVHNITEGGLEKAKEFGGIPVPSLAIAGKDEGFESFGDISLIGEKGAFAKDPTFASDVYSPRFPQSRDKIDPKAARLEAERLAGIVDPKIDSSFSSQFDAERLSEDITRLESSTGNRAAFLRGLGENIDPSKYTSAPAKPDLKMDGYGFAIRGKRLTPREAYTDTGHINATDKWLSELEQKGADVSFWRNDDGTPNEDALKTTYKAMRQDRQALEEFERGPKFDRFKARQDIDEKIKQNQEKFDSYIKDQKERISKGKVFTKWNPNTGTSKEFQFNLDNAVKLMKGNIRGGEGFSYGVGNIRAQIAPKLTSMKQIQDRRGQIVGEDQMTMVKEGFNSRLDNLYDSLSSKWAWASEPSYSDFADGITNAAKGDMGDFKGLNSADKKELQGFFDELANAPTNYFEIKPQRAVSVDEFFGAAVPEGTSKAIIDDLKSQGLEVEIYKPEKRKEAINNLNRKSGGNIFFSGAGAAMFYGLSGNEENENAQ